MFDVGANYGLHTLLFSRLAGDAGRVIAFEPNASLAQLLRRTILRLANTKLLECALSDEKGTATLHVPEDHSMGSLTDWRGGGHSCQCRTELLDELVFSAIVPPPDFVKVDVEGAEALVFRGAQRTLQTYRPIVVFEELKMAAEKFGYSQHSAAEFIQSLPGGRYRLYLAFEEGIVPLLKDRGAWCDIVAIPEERIPDAVALIAPDTFVPPAGRRS